MMSKGYCKVGKFGPVPREGRMHTWQKGRMADNSKYKKLMLTAPDDLKEEVKGPRPHRSAPLPSVDHSVAGAVGH